MIVGITGHRPDKLLGAVPRVRSALRSVLTELAPVRLLTGMALGTDQLAAEVCIGLNIPFVAVLPCDGQADVWPVHVRQHWQYLLEKAAEIVIVSPGPYKPWKMQRRNEYIVDNCMKLLAVWDGSDGGTANCLRYARMVEREIVSLDWLQA